jgi:peptidyl-prolyl cis-trans isomerase D
MLNKIREKTQGIIAAIILFLVGIPFILFGINTYFERGGHINVAKVDGEEITQVAYRRTLDELRGRVDPSMLDSRQFKEMIVESLVDQTLLLRDAEAQGYRVSNAQLDQRIRELPFFQRDGQFDPQLYQAFLLREGRDGSAFRTRMRAEMITGQVERGLVESAFVTDADIAAMVRLFAQRREIAHALIAAEKFGAQAAVTPEAIEDYYNTHTDDFKTEEQVRVEYIRLAAADLAKGYQPDDDALKRAYAEESTRYVTPEKRRASHILIEVPPSATAEDVRRAENKVRDIERQARGGVSFAELAKKYSMDPESGPKGGDLGEVRAGMLPKELDTAIKALKLNEISQPVRTSYGFHLVKVTGITPEKRKELKDVKEELVKLLRKRRAEERYAEVSTKLNDLVYESPDSLAPAAQALELEIQRSDWFTRAGGQGIAANLKVVDAAFQPEVLSRTRNSDVIELDAGTLVALRVAEHRPAARRPLVEVRAQIERILRQEKAVAQARALGQELLAQLRSGASLEGLAAKHGLKVQGARRVTRDEAAGVDRRIVEAAFRAPRPAGSAPHYDMVELGSQGVALVALLKVEDADPAKADAAAVQRVRRMLSEKRGAGLYAGYRAGLRADADIKIYRDNL